MATREHRDTETWEHAVRVTQEHGETWTHGDRETQGHEDTGTWEGGCLHSAHSPFYRSLRWIWRLGDRVVLRRGSSPPAEQISCRSASETPAILKTGVFSLIFQSLPHLPPPPVHLWIKETQRR